MEARWPNPTDLNPDDVSARNVATSIRLLAEYTSSLQAAVIGKRLRSAYLRVRVSSLAAIVVLMVAAVAQLVLSARMPNDHILLYGSLLLLLINTPVAIYFAITAFKEPVPPTNRDPAVAAEELRLVLRAAVQLEEHAARDLDTGSRVELDVRIKDAEAVLAHM